MERNRFTSHSEAIGNFDLNGDIQNPDFYYEIRWNGPMTKETLTKLNLAVIRNIAESFRTILPHL